MVATTSYWSRPVIELRPEARHVGQTLLPEVGVADDPGWAVTREDAAGRSRQVIVGVAGGQVSLRTPPGEAALMTWMAAEELRRLLAFAVARVLISETT
jgi:hypothetical protein